MGRPKAMQEPDADEMDILGPPTYGGKGTSSEPDEDD